MPNKGLDVVQVKLVMDKTLYSEEQLSSPDQVVQFMKKKSCQSMTGKYSAF
mgnify:CR=1 FL=1